MSKPEPVPRMVSISEAIYRRLLFLYPATFRRKYGEEMACLFRDQCRDAWHAAGLRGLAGCWFLAAGDMLTSAAREHCAEGPSYMNNLMRFLPVRRPAAVFSRVLAMTLLAAVFLVPLALRWQPPVYASTARVVSDPGREPHGDTDAEYMRKRVEHLVSPAVLNAVIGELDLVGRFARESGSRSALDQAEACQRLRGMLSVHYIRNTHILDVKVAGKDRAQTAEIANQIARTSRRMAKAEKGWNLEIVDEAEPGFKPVWPNAPLILCVVCLFCVVLSMFAALTARWAFFRRHALASSI